MLKVELDVLIDGRYNPFEEADDNNWKSVQDHMNNILNFAYIPVRILLYDAPEGGNVIAHYENYKTMESTSWYPIGGWVDGSDVGDSSGADARAKWEKCYLAYYDMTDRKNKSGIFNGWATNRQCIGTFRKTLPTTYQKRDEGEFIALPPMCGWIEVQVAWGLYALTYKRELVDTLEKKSSLAYNIGWWLMKAPKVSVVDAYGNDPDADDVVETAYINKKAKEQLTLSTIVGTPPDSVPPSARGAIRLADGSRVEQFTRAGQTDRLERLLINTVYSHHAERHATLSGTVELLTGFYAYRERSMPGVLFGLLSERQDLLADTSEVLMAELSADEYCPTE
jgi:hypothetical protein